MSAISDIKCKLNTHHKHIQCYTIAGSYAVNNKSIKRELKKLTNVYEKTGDNSRFDDFLRNNYYYHKSKVILFKLNKKIIAWCLVNRNWENFLDSGYYVHPNYRRMGIGSYLISKVQKIANRNNLVLRVSPWNDSSKAFFKANKVYK